MSKKVKISLLFILAIAAIASMLYCGVHVVKHFQLKSELEELQQKSMQPIKDSDALITGKDLLQSIKSVPCLQEISLISEQKVNKNGMEITGGLSEDELSSLDRQTYIEIVFKTSDVSKSLAYLSKLKMICLSISTSQNCIDMTVQIGG